MPNNTKPPSGPCDPSALSDDELQWLLAAVPQELETRRNKKETEILSFILEQLAAKAISPDRLRAAVFRKKPGHKRASAQEDKRTEVKPKYRDPKTGKTWSGRGGVPKWLADYIAAGGTKDELRIADPEGEA